MYEPYEEKKNKLAEAIDKIKEKYQEFWKGVNSRSFKENKWSLVLVLVAILAIGGLTYTGYTTYTARVVETQSKIMVLEKQNQALESNLATSESQLSTCTTERDSVKSQYTNTKNELEKTDSELGVCNSQVAEITSSLTQTKLSLRQLEDKINRVEENYDDLECNYAQQICELFNLEYYYLRKNKIGGCCSGNTAETCTPKPDTTVTIKQISC